MQPRMQHPVYVIPEAMKALHAVAAAARKCDLPHRTIELAALRVGQINGCSFCVEMHATELKKAGESDPRVFAVAASASRISDRADPVDDATWNEARRHYDDASLAALLIHIGLTNLWTRLNVSIKQVAGPLPR